MTTYTKKVCLLGDFAVGKTSLIRRFVYNRFDDTYISTIGVKVSRKAMTLTHLDGETNLTMMLWDIASSEEFSQIRDSYLRGTAGAIIVCDVTRPETIRNLQGYVKDLHYIHPDTRIVIAANKYDLPYDPRVYADRGDCERSLCSLPLYECQDR